MYGTARVDLAVVNHRLHGYEIKSDSDSLKRLPGQIRAYNGVLDRITLVVGYKHAHHALSMIPSWWGVMLACENQQGAVALTHARLPRDNPSVDLVAVAGLLWRQEGIALLDELGSSKGMASSTRAVICKRLVETCESDRLRARVRECLKSRQDWRVGVRQESYGD